MNQDQARRWAEEVLELADDYAEARHTKGDRSYNAETAAKREAIAAALVKLMQQETFYGHQFKEAQRGIWRCECGKQIIEGESKCTNGTRTISPSPQLAESQADTLTPVVGLAEQSARDSSTTAGNFLNSHPAPSQQEDRKPLSKEQLIDAYCVAPGIFQFVQAFIAGARFAEKHHNIKEHQ